MLIVLSSLVIVGFLVLYILIYVAATQSEKLAPIIIRTSEAYCDDPKFIHYFMTNSGIFVAGVRHRPAMALYSTLYSTCGFIAVVLAIFNFNYGNWWLFGGLIVIALHVFFSKTGSWFIHINDKICVERTLHNWLQVYPNDISPSYKLLDLPIQMLVLDYFNEARKISDQYFFGNINAEDDVPISNQSVRQESVNRTPPMNLNTISGILNSRPSLLSKYRVAKENLVVYKLYTALLNNRKIDFSDDVFEKMCLYLFVVSMKKFKDDFFADFNKANRFFDFSKYNEEQDEIYAEDQEGLEYDENYDWIEPKTIEEIDAFQEMEDDYEEDDKWHAIMERNYVKYHLLQFIEVRNKIKELNISEIDTTVQENKESIIKIERQMNARADTILKEKNRLESMSNSYISMDYSSINELQGKINWLERENDILLFIDKLLKENK